MLRKVSCGFFLELRLFCWGYPSRCVSVASTASNPDGCSDQNSAMNQSGGVPPRGAASGARVRKSELAAGKTLASWAWLFCLALLQKAALKQPALGAIAALPARSPLLSQPRDRGPSRSNSFETARALRHENDARRWPRAYPHSSSNYLNMSPAGTREQDRIGKEEPSRSAARASSEEPRTRM